MEKLNALFLKQFLELFGLALNRGNFRGGAGILNSATNPVNLVVFCDFLVNFGVEGGFFVGFFYCFGFNFLATLWQLADGGNV